MGHYDIVSKKKLTATTLIYANRIIAAAGTKFFTVDITPNKKFFNLIDNISI